MIKVKKIGNLKLPLEIEYKEDDWTFLKSNTRELTHCYHDYPARMIPQIASKLLDLYGTKAKVIFDPYCGTGTTLVEASLCGIGGIGTDLNPLARMIAKSKTVIPDISKLEELISQFENYCEIWIPLKKDIIDVVDGITNLKFWFKPSVIQKLNYAKRFVNQIDNNKIKLFFQVAFSETVRESSNTRVSEFKLYRYDNKTLEKHEPDVFNMMNKKLKRNLKGCKQYSDRFSKLKVLPIVEICGFDTVKQIPKNIIREETVDIVLTSPPYGDSHTTVAYGQYSRLSAAWLELPNANEIDKNLMGGNIKKMIYAFPCTILNETLRSIFQIDKKRAIEVGSFYNDLLSSISNVAKVIRSNGFACYVVGNRRVKSHTLPTSDVIKSFFEFNGFEHVATHLRTIPNKRMPMRNSPTNFAGINDVTMTNEYIVVMQKSKRGKYGIGREQK